MMSAKGMVMSAVALAVAGGTFVFLHQVFPPVVEAVQAPDTVPVEDVFKGRLDTKPPPAPKAEPLAQPETPEQTTAMAEPEPMPEAMEPEPAPMEPEPEPMEPEPMEPVEPEPMMAEPEPAEPMQPKPEPKPEMMAKPAPSESATPAPKPKPKATPAPIKAWWGPEQPDRLSLIFAGSAAYKKAIVLMFNSAFDTTDSAAQNIEVKDAGGKRLTGTWELGANNKRMLLFPVQKSGTYRVVVNKGLTDRLGRSMTGTAQGPVAVE